MTPAPSFPPSASSARNTSRSSTRTNSRPTNPKIIQPNGEILVIEPFNLDEIKTKFDNIYERTIQITDSINEIVSDKPSKESLQAAFVNFKVITDSFKNMLAENGRASRLLDDFSQLSRKFNQTADRADHLISGMDYVHQRQPGRPAQGIQGCGRSK